MRGLAGAVGIGFWEVRRDMDLLPAGLDTWPVHAADAELLADLELLLSGARIDLGGQVRPLPDGRAKPPFSSQSGASCYG